MNKNISVGKEFSYVLNKIKQFQTSFMQGCESAFIVCGSGSTKFAECKSGSRTIKSPNLTKHLSISKSKILLI